MRFCRSIVSQRLIAPLILAPSSTIAFNASHHLQRKLNTHGRRQLTSSTLSDDEPLNVLTQDTHIDWDDRGGIQQRWDNIEKGWKVDVEWKETQYGIGLFARQDMEKDIIIRVGKNENNLLQFRSEDEILAFCGGGKDDNEYHARLRYAKDYIWGQPLVTDDAGYPQPGTDWFYGMWVPGNGLNHNKAPNTVYRTQPGDSGSTDIQLVALTSISAGDELVDDYRRHGTAPGWLKDFAERFSLTLNFADCNDFVDDSS